MLTSLGLTIRSGKSTNGGSVLDKLPTQSQPEKK
jgi:hypothetical protein